MTAAVATVATLGALRLYCPFAGDQALFLIAAEKLHAGGVLYRDFWDIKQPGIFVFFLAGGSLFGFSQVGLHFADVLWNAIFALALAFGLRRSFVDARWAALAPLAVVGAYFVASAPWHLLQAEELAALPLFCCAWLAIDATRAPRHDRTLAASSGLAAGIVVAFKLVFAIVVLAIVVAIVATCLRGRERVVRARLTAAWLAGVAVPVAIGVAYAIRHDLLGEIVATFFVLPVEIAASARHAPYARLADSALRFALYYRGLIAAAFVAWLPTRDADPSRTWRIVSTAWLAAALATILIQRESWWQYHFALAIAPLGILATFGVADVARRARTTGPSHVLALAVGAVLAYVAFALPEAAVATALRIARERPYASSAARERFRAASSDEYATAANDARFFTRTHRAAGAVYVFGDPLLYVLAGREQAVAMNGWSLHLYTPAMWRRLDGELRATTPAFVFVLDGMSRGIIAHRSPETAALIASTYARADVTTDGAWYARVTPRRRRDTPRAPLRSP